MKNIIMFLTVIFLFITSLMQAQNPVLTYKGEDLPYKNQVQCSLDNFEIGTVMMIHSEDAGWIGRKVQEGDNFFEEDKLGHSLINAFLITNKNYVDGDPDNPDCLLYINTHGTKPSYFKTSKYAELFAGKIVSDFNDDGRNHINVYSYQRRAGTVSFVDKVIITSDDGEYFISLKSSNYIDESNHYEEFATFACNLADVTDTFKLE